MDLVAKVKNLVALAPVLGAISRPAILNEKDLAMVERGNYNLAIIKTTESYENLEESLSDLRNEMELLKTITVNYCKYNIKYFLGGDWKFLAFVCGLGDVN